MVDKIGKSFEELSYGEMNVSQSNSFSYISLYTNISVTATVSPTTLPITCTIIIK